MPGLAPGFVIGARDVVTQRSSLSCQCLLAAMLWLRLFDDLRRHCQQCQDEACFCRRHLQSYDAWARRLPLQPGALDESLLAWSNTWLWHKLQDGRFRWICQVCQEVETNMGANASVNMYALTQHHESRALHRSLTQLLGRAPPDVAPLAELFSEVFVPAPERP